ncbi:MAG TPA: N-acetyl-gamma-glutamyl-phosphate reductase [Dehalococcoidales bacterium]|nr:N-acetyl-gamma-glutamyl-phosphate reductase [Dehalococcoidales bacterium]
MKKIKVGIINVTGYVGVELARLLYQHPNVELTSVTGRSAAGQKLSKFFPHLAVYDLTITPELGDVEIAFSAMPHKESAKECLPLLQKGIRVIDSSADFRLQNPQDYPDWYGFTHPAPAMLKEAVFGLPEIYRSSIKNARLVAVPGCYPTGAILALAPAVKYGLIAPGVIVDSKSGVSGAGRSLTLGSHYAEANEDIAAYGLDGHRHLPEITQELNLLDGSKNYSVTFTPHLTPMTRGILSTCYADLLPGKLSAGKKGMEELRQIYVDFYKDSPFVWVADASPHTKQTYGSNYCIVYPTISPRSGKMILFSCIDNLVKGAAGEAIQNMNLMLGLPETTGLAALPVYP